MILKKKECAGCNSLKVIWKNDKGFKFCKECWYKQKPVSEVSKARQKPLKGKSDKQSALDKLYSILRIDYLKDHPYCEARLPECTSNACDIHHKAGRGSLFLVTEEWLAVCRSCHTWITINSKQAIEMGLSTKRIN